MRGQKPKGPESDPGLNGIAVAGIFVAWLVVFALASVAISTCQGRPAPIEAPAEQLEASP